MKKLLALMLLSATATVHAQGLMKNVGGSSSDSSSGSGGSSGESFDDDKRFPFYVGADLQNTKFSISDSGSFGGLNNTDYDSKFWDLRAGYRLFKVVGIEAHYGVPDNNGGDLNQYKVRNYYGIFAVPTANVFGLFELGFPIGYTNSSVRLNGDSTTGAVEQVQAHLSSAAYGANLEIPLRVFWRALPDFRITGGGMVYYQRTDAREYGYHFGLRYDFGFGNPTVAAAEPPPAEEAPAPAEPAPAPEPPAPPPAPACTPPAGFKVDDNCHIIEQKVVLSSVDFEFNSDKLTAPAQQTLDQVAAALAAQPELNVEIEGHTDSVGKAEYNMKLSQRRADAVKAYLVGKNVDGAHLFAQGYGKNRPIASNDTDEGRAQNRRVEFDVRNAPFDVKVLKHGASAASTEAAEQGPGPQPAKKHHEKVAAPAAASDAPAPAPPQ
jgi:outer membrane protein OmpA-like peptidoglycan-associated protein